MSLSAKQDQCSKCKTSLSDEGPCPNCGATGRIKFGECHVSVRTTARAKGKLIIGWQEVDRLLAKGESAAALLVAAVNVEFVLWENLRHLSPALPPFKKTHHSEWRTWKAIEKGDRDSVGLGSLIQLAQFYVDSKKLALMPPLKPFGWPLNEARKQIAHTRGFFARLTQLEETDWPETRIRQVLDDAKEFCHGNAP